MAKSEANMARREAMMANKAQMLQTNQGELEKRLESAVEIIQHSASSGGQESAKRLKAVAHILSGLENLPGLHAEAASLHASSSSPARLTQLSEMWNTPTQGEDVNMYQFVSHAMLLRATGHLGTAAPGLACMRPQLNSTQLEAYEGGTRCLAARVRAGVGIGRAERMIKDYIESPHTYAYLKPCMLKWDTVTQAAVQRCKAAITYDSSPPMERLITTPAASDRVTSASRPSADVRVFEFVQAAKLQRLTGLANGGEACLAAKGLNSTQMNSYSSATLCLGHRIKEGVGPYMTQRVVKDFLDAPDNYDLLYQCIERVGTQTKTAVRQCLRSMAQDGDPLPVVTFWWESM